MYWNRSWRPYVPVARRRANGARHAAKLAQREGRPLAPVTIAGKKIAGSFWGQAWCQHLENYSDYENRLPRGRTYVRNGSVVDLVIESGKVRALVSGSSVYTVTITIKTLDRAGWKRIKQDCAESIDSLIDLLQGRFADGTMRRLTQPTGGLFPQPSEIKMNCSCPDWAGMCKHVAATLYGVGARLDTAPELLFTLRNVDHHELLSAAVATASLDQALHAADTGALAGNDLGELFGIEIDGAADVPAMPQASKKRPKPRPSRKRASPATVATVARRKSPAATPAKRTAEPEVTPMTIKKPRSRPAPKRKSAKVAATPVKRPRRAK